MFEVLARSLVTDIDHYAVITICWTNTIALAKYQHSTPSLRVKDPPDVAIPKDPRCRKHTRNFSYTVYP